MTDQDIKIEGVYVGEEASKLIDEQNKTKIQLPPYPNGVLEWTEEEQKTYAVPEHLKENPLSFKMMLLWDLWGNLRSNEKLIEIINRNLPTDMPQDPTDELILKNFLVQIVDKMGKILNCGTELSSEIFAGLKNSQKSNV